MHSFDQYEQFLRIDKLQLDRCIEEQAVYFNEIAQHCSDAVSIRDGTKVDYERTYGEESLKLRKHWDEVNDGKLTEENLRQRVITNRTYVRLQAVYLNAKAEADKWLALKEAWQQRGFMLRLETELYVAGYFAEFTTKGGSVDEVHVTQLRQRMSEHRKNV